MVFVALCQACYAQRTSASASLVGRTPVPYLGEWKPHAGRRDQMRAIKWWKRGTPDHVQYHMQVQILRFGLTRQEQSTASPSLPPSPRTGTSPCPRARTFSWGAENPRGRRGRDACNQLLDKRKPRTAYNATRRRIFPPVWAHHWCASRVPGVTPCAPPWSGKATYPV